MRTRHACHAVLDDLSSPFAVYVSPHHRELLVQVALCDLLKKVAFPSHSRLSAFFPLPTQPLSLPSTDIIDHPCFWKLVPTWEIHR